MINVNALDNLSDDDSDNDPMEESKEPVRKNTKKIALLRKQTSSIPEYLTDDGLVRELHDGS